MHVPNEIMPTQHSDQAASLSPPQPLETKAKRIARARALIATLQPMRAFTLVPSPPAAPAIRATPTTTLQRDRRGA
jgi:hypothetical protein